jgi:nucleotide-binding universal stress UspA family protein
MGSRVVVGVDGSPESVAAFALAVQEARWRNATVQVVSAYTYPHAMLVVPFAPEPPIPRELHEEARALIDKVVERAQRSGTDTTGVTIEPDVVPGPPAIVLLDAARGADLLVVGARGRGGFSGLLLGSVSQQCVQHAPCPVLVVRRDVATGAA